MKKIYVITLLTFFSLQYSFAGEPSKPAKKDTSSDKHMILSLGGGFIYTSLNFFKNYQEDTYYPGNGFRLLLQINHTIRFCVSRDQVHSVDIGPMWLHVKNTYYDFDTHFICHFHSSKNLMYLIMGLSQQNWNGFYTGINDIFAWKLKIPPNTNYKTSYYGLTIGAGLELTIWGPLSTYGEFRFRLSKTDTGTGISDVLYSFGLKCNIPTPKRKKNTHHHSILKFHDKYHWF